jgi:hypothetical protein
LVQDATAYVPVRFALEHLGFWTEPDGPPRHTVARPGQKSAPYLVQTPKKDGQTVCGRGEGHEIAVTVGQSWYQRDEFRRRLAAPCIYRENRVLVPLVSSGAWIAGSEAQWRPTEREGTITRDTSRGERIVRVKGFDAQSFGDALRRYEQGRTVTWGSPD